MMRMECAEKNSSQKSRYAKGGVGRRRYENLVKLNIHHYHGQSEPAIAWLLRYCYISSYGDDWYSFTPDERAKPWGSGSVCCRLCTLV